MKRSMYILLIDLMQGLTPTTTMHSASSHNGAPFSIHILFYLHNLRKSFYSLSAYSFALLAQTTRPYWRANGCQLDAVLPYGHSTRRMNPIRVKL